MTITKTKILTKQKVALLVGVSALAIAGLLAAGVTTRLGITSSFKIPEFSSEKVIPGEIIVKFKSGKGFDLPAKFKTENKVQISEGLFDKHKKGLEKKGGKKLEAFQKYGLDRIHKIKLPDEANLKQVLADLSRNPDIEYAEPNYKAELYATQPNDELYGTHLWGLNNTGQTVNWWGGGAFHQATGTVGVDISAPEAWDIQTGANRETVVAVIDSGIDYNHPDLAGKIYINPNEIPDNRIDDDGNGFIDDYRGWDFAGEQSPEDNDPYDQLGHGTFIAGIIGGIGDNGYGIAGVNWNVKILPIRVFGNGGYDIVLKGLEYATLFDNVKIINASFGGILASYAQQDAIEALDSMGVLFVVAAGNEAQNIDGANPSFPAAYDNPNIISVAALDPQGGLANFSNYGPVGVDLAAPGAGNWSTLPTSPSYCGMCLLSTAEFRDRVIITDSNGGVYGGFAGTSFAAPHVAGAASILLAQNPNLTHYQLKELLLKGVDTNENFSGKLATSGSLNLARSLRYILWDYNNDGYFNDNDSKTFINILLSKGQCPASKDCDPNGDGKMISIGDVATIANELNKQGDSLDYNRDGTVDAADTQILQNVLLRKISCPIFKNCDVNGDGKIATVGDVIAHTRQIALRQPLAPSTNLAVDTSRFCVGGSNYSPIKFGWDMPEGVDDWQFEILEGNGEFPNIYYIEDILAMGPKFFATFKEPSLMEEPLISGHVSINLAALRWKPNTLYRWRVRSFDFQKEWGPVSEWAYGSFTTPANGEPCPFLPPRAYNLRTDTSLIADNKIIKFGWNFEDPDFGYMTDYQFQLDNDSDFSSPLFEKTSSAGELNGRRVNFEFTANWVDKGLTPGVQYYWRVMVKDEDNQWSDWAEAEPFSFDYQYRWPPVVTDLRVDTSRVCADDPLITFRWRFLDRDPGDTQSNASVLIQPDYRLYVLEGEGGMGWSAGTNQYLILPKEEFFKIIRSELFYEDNYVWGVKVYDKAGLRSNMEIGVQKFQVSCP